MCRELLAIGNCSIDSDETFADGYTNGNFYYDNPRHPRPQTSEEIHTFIQQNMADTRQPLAWNVGFIVGWLAALTENEQRELQVQPVYIERTVSASSEAFSLLVPVFASLS